MNEVRDEFYENLLDVPRYEAFYDTEFLNCNFVSGDLSGMKFHDCCFFGCDLRKANFSNAQFVNCRFMDCNLVDAEIPAGLEIVDVEFNKCSFGSAATAIQGRGVNFTQCHYA